MKYFTKEWYKLMQCLDYTICMKPIADKEYSDEEIAALYDKKLKAEIARDRRQYNEPPQFIEMDFDNAELDDFAYYDETTGTMKYPKSIEEVKREYEEEKARANEEFTIVHRLILQKRLKLSRRYIKADSNTDICASPIG